MEAIILAGGLGTRLQKVLPNVPKPMALIQGRPFLEFVLTHLSINGFQHAILSLGYRAEIIKDFFGAYFLGMKLSYVVEDSPLGTGGGMRLAVQKSVENHVYVLNGDTFLDLDFCRIEKLWQSSKIPTIVVRPVQDSSRYGKITFEDGRITGFIEKGVPGPGFMNAGCYIMPQGAIDVFVPGEPFSFELDYLVKEIARGSVGYCLEDGYFIDIGVPEDYERAKFELPKLFGNMSKP